MARYIDADALKQKIFAHWYTCEEIDETIDAFPTANVVEVVHGKNIGGGAFECSVCGFRDNYHDYEVHYCPNCGAKMDERREDNDDN